MSNLIHKETIGNKTLEIYYDEDPLNPRDEDNFGPNIGTILCHCRGRKLGDEQLDEKYYDSISDYVDKELDADVILLEVYMYAHGGITIRHYPFSCPWDSGKIGIIYVTRDDIKKKGLSDKTENEIKDILIKELELYDQYLQGNCYRFVILNEEGIIIDSCHGFIGDWEKECLSAGRETLKQS